MLFVITKNHWVTALDGLVFLRSSLTILSLVRAGDLMLQSTLSFVTTLSGALWILQFPAHASCLNPRKTRSSFSWRPSCSRRETVVLYVLFERICSSRLFFFFLNRCCLLQIYMTCILKATLASAPSDALHKSCSFANGYVNAV